MISDIKMKTVIYIFWTTDDMIIKAGMNIYPREIENAINKFT